MLVHHEMILFRSKNLGNTTSHALWVSREQNDPYAGALEFFKNNPQGHANGR